MKRISICCTLASLALLMTLLCLPVTSSCAEEAYDSLWEPEADGCRGGDTQLKRFDDGIDYDSFVSLMGRRSAAPPHGKKNTSVSRKRNIHGILAELLGRTKVLTERRMVHRSR